jgi:hypothetical protein
VTQTTPTLALIKPGGGSTGLNTPPDRVDIDVLNGNADKIDAFAAGVGLPATRTTLFYGLAANIGSVTPKVGDEYQESDGSKLRYRHDGTAWRLFGARQEAYTWSRANVDSTLQYPELVADVANTTDATLSSFQRVSGTDPDGPAGVKIAFPGTYHISAGIFLAANSTGPGYIEIGAITDYYWQRANIFSGADRVSVNQTVHTTAVDQVIPIAFYKANGNLGANTGRVVIRRLG